MRRSVSHGFEAWRIFTQDPRMSFRASNSISCQGTDFLQWDAAGLGATRGPETVDSRLVADGKTSPPHLCKYCIEMASPGAAKAAPEQ